MFADERDTTAGIREVKNERNGAVTIRTIAYYHPLAGMPIAARLTIPDGAGPFAAIVYAHWYNESLTDREEFHDEAIAMAGRGVVSICPETMWSAPEWFNERDRADDLASSLRQVAALQRAVAIVLAQPGVDPARLAYVGHDFGAMYGVAVAAMVDQLRGFVFMAGTERLSDWFLFGPPMEEPARSKFIAQFAPLDPLDRLRASHATATLFQFAEEDVYVPRERAKRLFAAAREPKKLCWYPTDHGLSLEVARSDREQWLGEQLSLR